MSDIRRGFAELAKGASAAALMHDVQRAIAAHLVRVVVVDLFLRLGPLAAGGAFARGGVVGAKEASEL